LTCVSRDLYGILGSWVDFKICPTGRCDCSSNFSRGIEGKPNNQIIYFLKLGLLDREQQGKEA